MPVDERHELASVARRLIEEAGFIAGKAHCAIEAKPPVQWNKGHASLYILRTTFGLDWSERMRIIYVGDDVTDEDAMQVISIVLSPENKTHRVCLIFAVVFKALKGMAATFRVVQSEVVKTSADRRLPSTDSVLTMLKWVERHFGKRLPRDDSVGDQSNGLQLSMDKMQLELASQKKNL